MVADRAKRFARSKSASKEAYEHSDAGKGDTDVPKGYQEKLEFARISQIVAGAEPHEIHHDVG